MGGGTVMLRLEVDGWGLGGRMTGRRKVCGFLFEYLYWYEK